MNNTQVVFEKNPRLHSSGRCDSQYLWSLGVHSQATQIAKFMGPTWGPMLAQWTLLSEKSIQPHREWIVVCSKRAVLQYSPLNKHLHIWKRESKEIQYGGWIRNTSGHMKQYVWLWNSIMNISLWLIHWLKWLVTSYHGMAIPRDI